MEAFSNFLESFDSSIDRSRLYNISSVVVVSADIEKISSYSQETSSQSKVRFCRAKKLTSLRQSRKLT